MPATTLHITDKDGKENRLMFITDTIDNVLTLNVYPCTEDYVPRGNPVTTSFVLPEGKTEADYHKNLRSDALEKGHLVKGHCTNPEWNPGYKPEDESITDISC